MPTYDEIADACDCSPEAAAEALAELGILNPAYVTDEDLDAVCDVLDDWEDDENGEDDDDEDLDEDEED